ncbi:MAG TPA: helix-hairpin-helix domain-containing protein [Patescibacteria group bacterium]|nr:helix-hairpin-helix domain-containing protein [Patescibacteria group bacterium]
MSRAERIVVAAGGGALVLVAAAAWMFLSPTLGDESPMASADPFALPSVAAAPTSSSAATSTVVVDVQGGVAEPGVRELPAGSRVADAIAAAGGYAMDADLEAAAASINLAQPLVDGGQVRVPRIGEGAAAAGPADPGPGSDGSGGGGIVNLNSATPEELEALPGIGPVTVQKIVAARQERPFASLEDAVQRGVINRGQLEDLQGLATAG